jgi:hypothetical protein
MQDRSYAIALVVILAICLLGMYVAVSGYMNSRSPTPALSASSPVVQGTPIAVVVSTSTPLPTKPGPTLPPPPTSAAVPSPLGVFQTITAAVNIPVPDQKGTPSPTVKAAVPPTVAQVPQQTLVSAPGQGCGNFTFCPSGGLPDSGLAPTGDQCPRNYVWGRVVDASGKGLPDIRVRFTGPVGTSDTVMTKGPPDPPGIYNIPAPSAGGNWTLWVIDAGGARISPQFTIAAQLPYAGSGNCPTRVDFKAQK